MCLFGIMEPNSFLDVEFFLLSKCPLICFLLPFVTDFSGFKINIVLLINICLWLTLLRWVFLHCIVFDRFTRLYIEILNNLSCIFLALCFKNKIVKLTPISCLHCKVTVFIFRALSFSLKFFVVSLNILSHTSFLACLIQRVSIYFSGILDTKWLCSTLKQWQHNQPLASKFLQLQLTLISPWRSI